MNFVTGALIHVYQDEILAFQHLHMLLEKYEMKNLYKPGVPELHFKNFIINHLIKDHIPHLSTHFRMIGMTPDYFTSKWAMTLFSNFLPLEAMPAIFDSMSLDGWTAIYRISISLLKVMEKDLLEMDMVTMCQYFREASHYGFIDL